MSETTIGLLCLHAALYFGTALAIGCAVVRGLGLEPWHALVAGVAGVSLAGYVAFWMFLASPIAGIAFDVSVLVASALLLRRNLALLRTADVIVPLALTCALAFGYLGALTLHADPGVVESIVETRFIPPTSDDVLPKWVAERVFNAEDPRVLTYSWRSSDRPPLQSGVVLLQRPFVSEANWDERSYELTALLFQLSWIAAVWSLCRTIGVSRNQSLFVAVLLATGGFFMTNSVFVWPKFSAAALEVFALTLFLRALAANRKLSLGEAALAGGLIALSLLNHGSGVFAIPALALLVYFTPLRPGVRATALGATVAVCLLVPWGEYQAFFDPPGNRLVKMHLAGVQPQADHRSAVRALFEHYRSLGLRGAVDNKLSNLETLAKAPFPLGPSLFPLTDAAASTAAYTQHTYVLNSLGILNFGWLALPALFFGPLAAPPRWQRSFLILLAVAAGTLAFWILVMFGPDATVTFQGSYLPQLILGVALALALARLPFHMGSVVLGLALASFVDTYLLHVVRDPAVSTSALAIAAIITCFAAVAILARRTSLAT